MYSVLRHKKHHQFSNKVDISAPILPAKRKRATFSFDAPTTDAAPPPEPPREPSPPPQLPDTEEDEEMDQLLESVVEHFYDMDPHPTETNGISISLEELKQHEVPLPPRKSVDAINQALAEDAEKFLKAKKDPYYPFPNAITQGFSNLCDKRSNWGLGIQEKVLDFFKKHKDNIDDLPSYAEIQKCKNSSDLHLFKEYIIGENPTVRFWCADVLTVAQRWLLDSKRYSNMKFKYEELQLMDDSGQKVSAVGEVVTSQWMKIMTNKLSEKFGAPPKMLPLIICSDATNVTQWNGHQVHPWYLACGNDPASVRNSPFGKQVIGYLEKVPGTIAKSSTKSLVQTYLWQQAAKIVMAPLVATQHSGCLMNVCESPNQSTTQHMFPLTMSHLADTPEAMKAAALFGGSASMLQKPCWTCTIPGNKLNSLDEYPTRDYNSIKEKVGQWLKDSQDPNKTAQAYKESKTESTFLLPTAFSDLWYINLAYYIPTCNEHYFAGGSGKKLVKWLPDVIKKFWGRDATNVTRFIDNCFRRFASQRIPGANNFPNGISNITLSANRDYQAVLDKLPYILHAASILYPADGTEKVVALYTTYMICYNYSKLEVYTKQSLDEFHKWLRRFQILQVVVCLPFCKSRFNNIKFHRLCHAAMQCLLYGCQESVTAGLYDALHVEAAKLIFKLTNRHNNCTGDVARIASWKMLDLQLYYSSKLEHKRHKKPTRSELGGYTTKCTVQQLMQANLFLRDLDILLADYFRSIGEPLLCINSIILTVHNSAKIVPSHPKPWLGTHIVASDQYGESKESRRDDVMLSSNAPFPLFGRVLRLFRTSKTVGEHQFALVQLYEPVSDEELLSPVFGELRIKLTDNNVLYPLELVKGSVYLMWDPLSTSDVEMYIWHTGIFRTNMWCDTYESEREKMLADVEIVSTSDKGHARSTTEPQAIVPVSRPQPLHPIPPPPPPIQQMKQPTRPPTIQPTRLPTIPPTRLPTIPPTRLPIQPTILSSIIPTIWQPTILPHAIVSPIAAQPTILHTTWQPTISPQLLLTPQQPTLQPNLQQPTNDQ